MLATKRNFLIIVNFRDCFSIKLFISIRLSMPSASPKKYTTFVLGKYCLCPKSSPRVCTFRCAQSHKLCYFDAITWRPQIATFRCDLHRTGADFRFQLIPILLDIKLYTQRFSFCSPYVFAEHQQQRQQQKMLKSVQLWSHFLYGDFTNTHDPEKLFCCLRLN